MNGPARVLDTVETIGPPKPSPPTETDSSGREETMIRNKDQDHIFRDMTLRTLPFFIFVVVALLAISHEGWTQKERVGLLLTSMLLFLLLFAGLFSLPKR